MRHSRSFWELGEWSSPPDLLIVGGGIVGTSAALFYKRDHPEKKVVILDRGEIPEGASTRNAGFACIGSVSEHLADLKSAGEEVVLNRIERRWRGLNRLKSVLNNDAIGYEPCGGHEIFPDDKLYQTCTESVGWLNDKLNERLGEKEIYTLTSYQGYPAIKNRVEGAVHSGKLMRELHYLAARKGVLTYWNTEVLSADSGYIRCSGGIEMEPKRILLATNGFTLPLVQTDVKIEPARGYIFVTNPIPGLPWKGTFHVNEGYIYFRNVGERLMLGGARNVDKPGETTHEFGINESIRNHLVDFANNTLQLSAGWHIDMEWSGIMGMTPSKEPVVKRVKENVYVAAGLSGMGVAIGMDVAQKAAELISE